MMDFEHEIDVGRLAVLVVDEDGENLDLFRMHFRGKFQLISAGSAEEALDVLSSREPALAVVEYSLPDRNGLEFLSEASRIRPNIIGILMSATAGSDFLVDVVNSGLVWRFVQKPWEPEDVEAVLNEGMQRYRRDTIERSRVELQDEIASYYDKEITETLGFNIVVGEDGDLAEVMEKVRYVAKAAMPVLLRGERGVGRELLATTLHRMSDRADKPFIKLDAITFPKNIHERELFGAKVETEGDSPTRGRVELSEGGTLFIENIEDLSPEAQFRLAELLNAGAFERVGGTRQLKADVRVVATCVGELNNLVDDRVFRADLLDALNDYPIDVPPLRDRKKDIPALAQFFANRIGKSAGLGSVRIETAAMEKITSYHWPGNLKELTGILESAIVNCMEGVLRANNILTPIHTTAHAQAEPKRPTTVYETEGNMKTRLEGMERDQIQEALKKTGGKKALAARLLGINRSTLYYRMRKYGISY